MAINEFMNTMGQMRLFNKGEYMVISVDRETYSPERARDYLWSQLPTIFSHLYLDFSQSNQRNFWNNIVTIQSILTELLINTFITISLTKLYKTVPNNFIWVQYYSET